MQLPDGARWKYQNDYVRDNVEGASDEDERVIVETFCIGYERIPIRCSWGTSEYGDETANRVEYPSDNNHDPGTVPYERINGLMGCEQAEVLQQNSRLDQENCGAVLNNLKNIAYLSNNQSTIGEQEKQKLVDRES